MRRLALMTVLIALAACDDRSTADNDSGGNGGAALGGTQVANPAPVQPTPPSAVVTSDWGILGSARAVAVQAGFLYVAGADSTGVSGGSGTGTGGGGGSSGIQWRIEKRLLSDGSLSPAFGTSGVVLSDKGMSNYVHGMAADAAFVYALGSHVVGPASGPNHYQWRIEKRFVSDGSLDLAFGSGGAVVTDPGGNGAFPGKIAIDSGFLYAVGNDYSAGNSDIRWRMEKRRLSDGALVPSFGAGGVVTSNPGAGGDGAFAIAIGSGSAVIVGMQTPPGTYDSFWRMEKRSLQDGSIQWAATSAQGSAMTVAMDSEFAYVAGSERLTPLSHRWRIEKRRLSDGGADAAFAGSGSVAGPMDAVVRSIAVDNGFVYAGGLDSSSGFGAGLWRAEKRSARDGSLDLSFGSSGVVLSDPGRGSDQTLHAVATGPSGLYLAGGPGLRLELRTK